MARDIGLGPGPLFRVPAASTSNTAVSFILFHGVIKRRSNAGSRRSIVYRSSRRRAEAKSRSHQNKDTRGPLSGDDNRGLDVGHHRNPRQQHAASTRTAGILHRPRDVAHRPLQQSPILKGGTASYARNFGAVRKRGRWGTIAEVIWQGASPLF